MSATLPERVIIGPMTYTITDTELESLRAVAENDGNVWGKINYGEARIVLHHEQSDEHKRMTLFHEIMHGVWHLSDRAHDGDEEVIRRLAAPLLDVLRRNPDLVAYLTENDHAIQVTRPDEKALRYKPEGGERVRRTHDEEADGAVAG